MTAYRHFAAYYNQHAGPYRDTTLHLDMSGLYQPFLALVPPGGRILDAGCGPGRDLKAFRSMGYRVEGIDGAAEFVRMAQEYSGAPVQNTAIADINASSVYDGIWASASLLHTPPPQMPEILQILCRALKPARPLYASFKCRSEHFAADGREFTCYNPETFAAMITAVPDLQVLKVWITTDQRPDRGHELWLNTLMLSPPAPVSACNT